MKKRIKELDELDEISEEAQRIAKWLNSKETYNLDFFVMELIMNLNLNYFETLGLLEHLKSELQRISNEEVKKEN